MVSSEIRERIWQIALRRGIFFPAAEIYSPVGGIYDLGPVGKALKERIIRLWRSIFIERNGFLEIESSLILPEPVLKASGHLDHFSDPITTCKLCGNKFRADHLLEENNVNTAGKSIDEINQILKVADIKCPTCGRKGFSEVEFFNLMFKTNIGPVEGTPGYLRPETAQGIYLAFPRLFRVYGKLPLGIGQAGKSFRNEISPRQGFIRLREFTQMELEYFFDPSNTKVNGIEKIMERKVPVLTRESQQKSRENPNSEPEVSFLTVRELIEKKIAPNEPMAFFLGLAAEFYERCGIPSNAIRFRHLFMDEVPHYSGGNFDPEVETSYGHIEVAGIAYRTDYDLKSHSQLSGKDLSVTLPDGRKIIPHVVEPSLGVERLIWAILEHSYRGKDEVHDWEWFDIPAELSPYDVAVFPLMKKDGLAEKAQEITSQLREKGLTVLYDESGSIGKRYARADEIGMKWAVTIDYDTLKDNTVTIRDRNSAKQIRIEIEHIPDFIKKNKGIN
jgi:glycyl-tRNA synthetase